MTTYDIDFDRLMEAAREFVEKNYDNMGLVYESNYPDIPYLEYGLDEDIIDDDLIGCYWFVVATRREYYNDEWEYEVSVTDDEGNAIIEFKFNYKN